uniref:WAP domain-containing protein n=1 Tax=Salvator merianae TaxID=96440 RepID=A0A8D0BFL2_SALMN
YLVSANIMKTISAFFLVTLLAFCLERTPVSSTRIPGGRIPGKSQDSCLLQVSKQKNTEFVFHSDFFSFIADKPGLCPLVTVRCRMLDPPNRCDFDYECIGNLKCCESFCGRDCVPPVFGTVY